MQIGASTACYYPLETEKSLKLLADAGFKIFEVFVNAKSEYSSEYIKEFNKKCDFYGLSLYSFHPFTSFAETMYFFTEYKRRMIEGIENYKKQFYAAKQMGAKVFNFHGDYIKHKTDINLSFEIYATLREKALEEGIIFAQENVANCKSGDLEFVTQMRDCLKDNVEFTFDVKQANRAGYSPFDILKAMSGRIINVHLSDYSADNDCLLPSMGELDTKNLLNKIMKSGYSGPAIIEVYKENYKKIKDIENSRNFLEGIFVQKN